MLVASELARELLEARARTDEIFAVADPAAYYERPIPLRHPIAFYEGHLDAFNINTLLRGVLGQQGVDDTLDALFARGIDPADEAEAERRQLSSWPDRAAVAAYRQEANRRVQRALREVELDGTTASASRIRHVVRMLIEHELMHQETLLYLIHELPHGLKRHPQNLPASDLAPAPHPAIVEVAVGKARLGARPGEFAFGWDNEFPAHEVAVPAFRIDAYKVTNAQYLDFVQAGGYEAEEFWDEPSWAWKETLGVRHPHRWRQEGSVWLYRDFFEDIPLPASWPVYVTQAEAAAYARFRGCELPSEAEWHRAAFGDQHDWPYPWGFEPPTAEHGNFDFVRWSPTRVGSSPRGASPLGVHELVGNGWEWTRTPFMPFAGFRADPHYPGYSADFFDGEHFVIKGGCCFTARPLLRRSFRNWYFRTYPYPYAGFRLVSREA